MYTHAEEWGESWGEKTERLAQPQQPDEVSNQVQVNYGGEAREEIGFLDAMEEVSQETDVAKSSMHRIGEATSTCHAIEGSRTGNLTICEPTVDRRSIKVKRVANLAAGDLENG